MNHSYFTGAGKRTVYLLLTLLTIITGLVSREIPAVPLATGDALWATMIYFGIRFLFFRRGIRTAAMAGILVCLAVEFSQLYHTPWLDALRATLPGKLLLGQGFLWSDLIAYMLGVALGATVDVYGLSGRSGG